MKWKVKCILRHWYLKNNYNNQRYTNLIFFFNFFISELSVIVMTMCKNERLFVIIMNICQK